MARNPRTNDADFDAMSAVNAEYGVEGEGVSSIEIMRGNFEVPVSDISDNLFDVLPPGYYGGTIKKVGVARTKAGDKTLAKIEIKVTQGHDLDNDPTVFQNITLTDEHNNPDAKGFTRLKILFQRVAPEALGVSINPARDLPLLIGKDCVVRLEVQEYEGRESNNVRDILSPQAAAEMMDDQFITSNA